MCNLYNIRKPKEEIASYFKADWRPQLTVEKDYAAPGKPGYVVREAQGERLLDVMTWGFPTREPRMRPAKEGQSPFIVTWWTNARNLSNNMWRPWLEKPEQRCLVPFTEFSEPKVKEERAGPGDVCWWFSLSGQPIAAFAGVWKSDPEVGPVYSFATCEPNPLVAPKHPKAMPVILMAEQYDQWLQGSFEDVLALQAPYPSQMMGVA